MANETGVKSVLSPDRRREMALRGLSGENRGHLAGEYGVTKQTVQTEIRKARELTEADAAETSKRLEFQKRVLQMLENEKSEA